MSVKTSVYDFFGFALHGAIILLILLHGMETLLGYPYFSQLASSTFSNWFVFGLASYVAGFVLEPLIHFVTTRYSKTPKAKITAFESLKNRNKNLNINIDPTDWALWFATIRRENMELAYEIDRMNAQSKMMSGISFASLLFSLLMLLYVILGKAPVPYLWSIPVSSLVTVLSIRQANRYKIMFFMIIFETVISRNPPFTPENKGQ